MGMDREIFYKNLLADVEALISGCDCPISNCANISALLYNRLRSEYGEEATNWTGFYFRSSENTLQLGPFCGLPACQTLKFEKGVCGAAAAKNETLLVENVHDFPGHVACDAASNSELVVPLVYEGRVVGVLDMDSPVINGFGNMDKKWCESIVKLVERESDFSRLARYYQ